MGISLAEYFRQVIGRDLGGLSTKQDVTQVFDLGTSGHSDVSENIDRYVGEAVEANYLGSIAGERRS